MRTMVINSCKTHTLSALFVLAALSLALASCHTEPRPKPPVMDEATLANFLEEAYVLEGFYALETHFHYDTLHPQMIASYDSLFAKYGISYDVFDTTISWYAHNPDIYKRVHDSVVARLIRRGQ